MKHVIHIYGASGSGTSTLGKALAKELGWRWMDSDDYFWMPTDPPYTTKRSIPERINLMEQDIDTAENAVVSGSLVGWGDALMKRFTLAVRVDTDTAVRLARIRERERRKFGVRILPGGDMFDTHQAFLKWAAGYDEGGLDTRSRARHDEWEKGLSCPIVRVNGMDKVQENVEKVKAVLKNNQKYAAQMS